MLPCVEKVYCKFIVLPSNQLLWDCFQMPESIEEKELERERASEGNLEVGVGFKPSLGKPEVPGARDSKCSWAGAWQNPEDVKGTQTNGPCGASEELTQVPGSPSFQRHHHSKCGTNKSVVGQTGSWELEKRASQWSSVWTDDQCQQGTPSVLVEPKTLALCPLLGMSGRGSSPKNEI